MSCRLIGYYVHHHGAGHLARARAIAAASAVPIVFLGTGLGDFGIDLPDDRMATGQFDGEDTASNRPEALHYAPLHHPGIQSRVAAIAQWIADARPALMIIDVSVEVAMLARLASVPTVYVRLNGDRNDPSHLEAFRGASALLAPYHADLEMPSTPGWVRAKTQYIPGITTAVPQVHPIERLILVVVGKGGPPVNTASFVQAACACPEWHWRVIGPVPKLDDVPPNLEIIGWIDDARCEIAQASLVVGAAGDGLINSVLAARRPFICIPEDRPFDEQRATASRLRALDAAVVVPEWPKPDAWASLIRLAQVQPPSAKQRLHDSLGAHVAADWLLERAASLSPPKEYAA